MKNIKLKYRPGLPHPSEANPVRKPPANKGSLWIIYRYNRLSNITISHI